MDGNSFFSLEARVGGYGYDGRFGISNPSSSDNFFLAGTGQAGKRIYLGDWHSHYTDNKSTLEDDINYGKLGFKSDFIGATNKTFYDSYPQNKQITLDDFKRYVAANDQYNANGQFLSVPNEEWPKVITYYNPYRSSLESPTVLGNPGANLTLNWVHNMMLFKDATNAPFFGGGDPANANFFQVTKKFYNSNSVMIPHHSSFYDWKFYDSTSQADMRVYAFNGYEGGWDATTGVDKMMLSGAKMGFVGESDSHQGTAAEGGLSGVYLSSLDRSSLIDAIKRRDVYASSSFGKPLVYFAMTGPVGAEMGKENFLSPGQKPTFKTRVLLSSPIQKITVWRGAYGGTTNESLDIAVRSGNTVTGVNGATCNRAGNSLNYVDCTWTDTSATNYNYYYINGGNSDLCTRRDTWNFTMYAEHCFWSSPIWITRSNTNFVYGDLFNNVADQGWQTTLKTRFVVNPSSSANDTTNLAIFLGNDYPTKNLTLNSFRFNGSSDNDWYKNKTVRQGNIVDFKVRKINGVWQFAGLDYRKVLGGQCNNPLDNSCVMAALPAGDKTPEGFAKYIGLNTDGTYTTNPIRCTRGTYDEVCSYAILNVSQSKITQGRYSGYPADMIDVEWVVSYSEFVKERIYEMYTNAASTTGLPQGWRRVGSVLAHPTGPSGTIDAASSADTKGNITLKFTEAPSDDYGGATGVGNAYFRVTDVDATQNCSFLNEDWLSTDAVAKQNYTFKYQLRGVGGQRRICYYFKDLYGLESFPASFVVEKPTSVFVTPTVKITPPPSAPTGLSHSCTENGLSCTLRWNAVPGATSYSVNVDNLADGWGQNGSCTSPAGDFCAQVNTTSYTFTSKPGASYNWNVVPLNSAGSGPVSVTPNFTAPSPVTPTPTKTPTPKVTLTPVNTITPTATKTPTPTASATPRVTLSPTKTPTVTITTVATTTPTKTPTPKVTTTVSPTTVSCPRKPEGDADCNNSIDLMDFELFRQDYLNFRKGTLDITTAKADFNFDKSIDLLDFELFRQGYLKDRGRL